MTADGDSDRLIRERLLAELRKQEWAKATELNVVVWDGVVHFWGTVGSEEEIVPVEISPLAGDPATPAMLIDVPRLVTAYYTDVPDSSVQERGIAFGIGDRGSSFENTFNQWHWS